MIDLGISTRRISTRMSELVKEWNEITVMLNMTKDAAVRQLSAKGYEYECMYHIHDYYFIHQTADLNRKDLELLNEMVLIRVFDDEVKMTVKHKEYAADGSILAQSNTDLSVANYEQAEAFLIALGYKRVMEILDEAYIMKKDGLGFVIEDVNEGTWLMLEIEENEQYPEIADLKKKLKESGLLYDDSDYFVKKAQLVFMAGKQQIES